MTTKSRKLLRKALLVAGIMSIGWTVNAQAVDNTDSTHRAPMHRHWGPRNGGDSLAHKDGFRPHPGGPGFGGPGGREGWAGHRPEGRDGRGGWANHRPGDHRDHRGFGGGFRGHGIRYTPEQRKQVMAINKDYKQKAEDLYKQDNLTLKQYKAGLVNLQKEKKGKLEALLTQQQKDQIAKSKKMMDENRQVAEAAHMERLKLRLSLTDDQVSKIKAGNASLRSQFQAIHENDNLLPQQKMQQMKDLMAKRKDVYKSVLTPNQYTQFEKMFQHQRDGRGFGRPGFGGPHFGDHDSNGPGGPEGPGGMGFDGPGPDSQDIGFEAPGA